MPKIDRPGDVGTHLVGLTRRVEHLERSQPSMWVTVAGATYSGTFEDYVTLGGAGAGFRSVGYYRDPTGECWLRGAAATTGLLSAATNYTILTLPTGFRPAATEGPFTVNAVGPDRYLQVNVNTDGTVVAHVGTATVAANSYISLAGIHFSTVD